MNLLETSPAQPLVMALGWALIHFTWQGALVALVLACVLRVSQRQSANARYAAACAAMLLMPALPLVTIAIIGLSTPGRVAGTLSPAVAAQPDSRRLVAGVGPAGAPTQAGPGAARPQPWPSGWSQRLAPSFPWMALAWLSGVIFFSLRLISGWLYTRRLRLQGNRLLAEEWQGALRRLGGQLRVGRAVRLLESASLKAPASIGWLRPVILLPIGAVAGLTPQHLEAIIAHELAHIRRHDYLVNLLQSVIETLLFYHPAVWWVSRRMRQEREYCCDDLAAAACGDVLGYARALLEMEELRAAGPQLAVAANGGVLMNRIQRLIGAQPQPTNHYAGLFAGILMITGVLCVGVGAQILLPPLRSESTRERTVSARKGEAGQADTVAAAPAEPDSAAAGRPARADQPARVDQDDAAEALLPALRHSSWEVRKAAVEKLARFRGTRPVDLLLDALNDDHRQVREQAVTVLGAREDERLAEYLAAALTDGDWQVREQAAIALGRRGDGRAVEPLLKALVDSEWAVREQAARSLGGIGGEPAVEPLIHALRDQHEQVREAAAKSLGAAGDRRAVEPLRQALEDVSEQVRKKAAEALGSLKQSSGGASPGAPRQPSAAPEQQATQPAVAAESLRALSSSSPAERAAAACSLGRLGAVEAIPALVHLLGDEALTEPLNCWGEGHWSPARQTFKQASPGEQAAIALAALGQSAVEPLVVALSSNDPGVRRNAAWAIGEIRGGSRTNRSAAVEPLIAALRDADLWVRVAAAFSLGELRPPRATEALIMALGDAEWNAREMAAWALGEMKARPGVESLTALLLRDGDGRVRRQAAWALGEIRDPQALDSLTAALTDEDQRVRATARWAIAEIRD